MINLNREQLGRTYRVHYALALQEWDGRGDREAFASWRARNAKVNLRRADRGRGAWSKSLRCGLGEAPPSEPNYTVEPTLMLAMSQLSRRHRAVIKLKFWYGYSWREACAMVGFAPSSYKLLSSSILDQLRRLLCVSFFSSRPRLLWQPRIA